MEIENLRALIKGVKLNPHQKALAVKEFEHLLASNGNESQALSMSGVIKSVCPMCGDKLMHQVNSTNLNCVRCGETVRKTVL